MDLTSTTLLAISGLFLAAALWNWQGRRKLESLRPPKLQAPPEQPRRRKWRTLPLEVRVVCSQGCHSESTRNSTLPVQFPQPESRAHRLPRSQSMLERAAFIDHLLSDCLRLARRRVAALERLDARLRTSASWPGWAGKP